MGRVEMPARSYRASFVVDETGQIDLATVTATPSPPDLVKLQDRLARIRYTPATVRGCAVPSRATRSVTLSGSLDAAGPGAPDERRRAP